MGPRVILIPYSDVPGMDTDSYAYLKAMGVLKSVAAMKEAKETTKAAKCAKSAKDGEACKYSLANSFHGSLTLFTATVISSADDADHLLTGYRRSLAEVQVDLAVLNRRMDCDCHQRNAYLAQIADLESHIASVTGKDKGTGKGKEKEKD